MKKLVNVSILAIAAACVAMAWSMRPSDAASDAAAPSDRPNIVFILVDDLGWADVGAYGSRFYETPHVDRLSSQGVSFTNAYAASPVCSPARASIMTGRHPARLHMTDWIPGQGNRSSRRLLQVEDRDHLPLAEVTIAERLKDAGYATAHMGKWHLGGALDHLPTDQGFDVNVGGYEAGGPRRFGGYFSPYDNPHLEDGPDGEYLTDRLGEEAARFIQEHRERPFFLYLSFYTVHRPLQAPEEVVAKYEARADMRVHAERAVFDAEHDSRVRIVQNHPVYAAMVESMDRNVGRVLRALEEAGVEDDTIVIFTSDNGGLSVQPRDGAPTANTPLRAGKGWLYEGGIRVPLVVSWPGQVGAGTTREEPVSSADFLPTMVEMAGLVPSADRVLDGVSLVPLLREGHVLDRDALYWHYPHYHGSGARPGSALRVGDYKLVEYLEDGRVELYDLAEDLSETRDLAGDEPERAAALKQQLERWRRSVDAQMPGPNPDYTGADE